MTRAALRLLALAAALAASAPIPSVASAATPAPARSAPAPPPHLIDPDGLSGVLRGVPRLIHRSPDAVADAWDSVKHIDNPSAQLRAFADKGLDHMACDGLVDLRAAVHVRKAPFGFRDNVRGRSWARPSLARVLLETMRRFQLEYPGKTVAIGDASQPGCGQVDHGTLVHLLSGAEAAQLVNRARIIVGRIRPRKAPASS